MHGMTTPPLHMQSNEEVERAQRCPKPLRWYKVWCCTGAAQLLLAVAVSMYNMRQTLLYLTQHYDMPTPSQLELPSSTTISGYANGTLGNVTASSQLDEAVTTANLTLTASTTLKDDTYRNFGHYITHIPKSGASYAAGAINELLFQSPEYLALPKEKQFRICNVGKSRAKAFPRFQKNYHGVNCTLWMSESIYSPLPHHIYTLLRNPKHQVLSHYFHCKESEDHSKRSWKLPPTLNDWLQAWVDAIEDPQKAKENRQFRCYDPRNFQSKYVLLQPVDWQDQQLNKTTEQDLKRRYDVIADSSQMTKSICMITIRYARWVPQPCNCTLTTKLPQANTSQVTAYDPKSHSHGVIHHGATYETTPQQDAWIDQLTKQDQWLYEVVQRVFDEQVKEVEAEYQFQLCDQFRNTVGQ